VPYRLRYHPDVKAKDTPKLNQTIQRRIKTALEQKLLVSPEKYSEPLKRTLKGYRKLRVGNCRIGNSSALS
jgi:mRNA interferase RelE/StbE